jgi:hypothetical protein
MSASFDAAQRGHLSIVESLIASGAEPQLIDARGRYVIVVGIVIGIVVVVVVGIVIVVDVVIVHCYCYCHCHCRCHCRCRCRCHYHCVVIDSVDSSCCCSTRHAFSYMEGLSH